MIDIIKHHTARILLGLAFLPVVTVAGALPFIVLEQLHQQFGDIVLEVSGVSCIILVASWILGDVFVGSDFQ
jgi:hypothetical protein